MESGKENEECDMFGICEGKGEAGRIWEGATVVLAVIFIGQ